MKKLLIIPALFISSASFALCPIDSEKTVCSLPQFQGSSRPVFQNQKTNLEMNKPNTMLQPLNKTNPIEEIRGPNVDMNYNSGCQFGVCLPNPNRSNLPNATD
ncbi:hypothetical protein IJ750_00325 [bacterium]|nr:hypothetical protein [bacterium]